MTQISYLIKALNLIIWPALMTLMMLSSVAQAQTEYPNRPVKIVIPFPVGGLSDSLARLYGKELSERLGQPFIVESKPGASTNIGAAYVASATNDGYTLLVTTIATNALNKWSNRPLSFDPHGFSEIGMLGVNTLYVMVGANSPYRTVQDIVKAAKENPQGLSYGSFGIGTPNHMLAEMFKQSAGIQKLTHVPYKGASDSSIDLMAGRIDFMIDVMPNTAPHVRNGRLKGLAVSTLQRVSSFPDIPTIAESGVPGFDVSAWDALFAPAGTPPAVLEKVGQAMQKILADESLKQQLSSRGSESSPTTPGGLRSFIQVEIERWGQAIKRSGTTVD